MGRVLLAVSLALATSQCIAAPPEKGIGINVTSVHPGAPTLPFVDVFKQSSGWSAARGTPIRGETDPLTLDRNGWVTHLAPGQKATTLVLAGSAFPAGKYSVSYDGQGDIVFGLDAKVIDRGRQSALLEVNPKQGVRLTIEKTNPADPVRNIAIYLPGHNSAAATQPFNPRYLEYLRGFRVIRFVLWTDTNYYNIADYIVDWDSRTRPEHATQGGKAGVALEYMIRLARELGANPWFNVPTRANDDFVRKMAMLIKQQQDPGRLFYIEYSNEVWNSSFAQHSYAISEAARLGLRDADAFYVSRSMEIFRIFEEVFSGSSRFVRVLSGQAVNVDRTRKLLSYPGIERRVDAYAIAPYFGYDIPRARPDQRGDRTDEIMLILERDLERAESAIRATRKLTTRARLPLIAYEAGQHVTNPPGNDDFCAAINRDARMESLYRKYIDAWIRETSGSLLMLFADIFTPGRHGCWGLSESLGQDVSKTPKLRAVRHYLR